MQLQNFARQILVQSPAAVDAGNRVRPDRRGVVEIEQHRRMGFGGEQHVGEAAEHMRPDRLALIGAGETRHLVGRHAEMVGPEPHQPFGKADLGAERRGKARLGFAADDVAHHIGFFRFGRRGLGRGLGRRHGVWIRAAHGALAFFGLALGDDLPGPPFGAEFEGGAHRHRAAHEMGAVDPADVRPVELGEQCAARIGGNGGDRAAAGPKAKAVQRKRRGLQFERHERPRPGVGTQISVRRISSIHNSTSTSGAKSWRGNQRRRASCSRTGQSFGY